MVVVTASYQALRWALAVAIAVVSALLANNLRFSWYPQAGTPTPTSWLTACFLGFLSLTIVPKLLSFYAPSPCLCDVCTERNRFEPLDRRLLVYVLFAYSLSSLRRVAEDVYAHCAIAQQTDAEGSVIAIHVALAHMAIRTFDRRRSGHLENKPGQWSKDRILPVQPPLNNASNAITVLKNLIIGCSTLLMVSFVPALALRDQGNGLVWLICDPKASGIALAAVLGLQREFWFLGSLVARAEYDKIEEESQAAWQQLGVNEEPDLCTWLGFSNLILN